MSNEQLKSQQQDIHPFYSGSQYADWTICNCARCSKGAHLLGPDALPTCEIELALGEAYILDGKVNAEIARRMGYAAEGWAYTWQCHEVNWTDEWKAECNSLDVLP